MAGASPPSIPDTLNILYFGTLLTAILWSSRHDIRTAILSLAALTAMGLITPFLGSPAPALVHIIYLAVATLAFCLSDSDGTKLITVNPPFSVSESLTSVGTVLASVGRALLGILRFHAAVLRIIFAAIVLVDRSVVGVIRGALYIVRSTYSVARGGLRIVAVTVRGTLYVAALIRRFVCIGARKCLWTIALSIRCIWALLAGPVLVTKALTIGPIALLGDTLCFITVTIPVIFRAIVYAATIASKLLRAAVYASAVVSVSIVAVSKRVFSTASKCMLAISKLASPREPEPARIVRIVLCPDDYALYVPHTHTVTRGAWPLLRGFDAGVLLALVVFNIVRDVLPATSKKVIGSMSNLVAEAYFCPELALSIGVSAVGYYTAAPLALAVLDVQDVSDFVKRSFSGIRNICSRVMVEISVAAAVILHYIWAVDVNNVFSIITVDIPSSSLQLVPGAVSKKIKRAVPVIARRPLGIYAISPRWLEVLQTRLYLRSIPCSLFATDYFRIISRQFDIPGALAMAISRPRALAVVKKPQAIRRTARLVVEFVKDGGDLPVTVFVYNLNARLEKMLLAAIRVSGVPRSLFATDYFRMIAKQFASPTVLMPFIGPVARVQAISRRHGLAVVKNPLAICNASRLVVEVVNDNGNLPVSVLVYNVNARLEKTILVAVRISGVPRSFFATDHFRMIAAQFATPRVLMPFIGPIARRPDMPVARASKDISPPHDLAVVKKPSICNASQLVVEIENDKGNSPVRVFVYNLNPGLEKTILAAVCVSSIPRSLFATDHFRMIAQQFATPLVLVPFIGPLLAPLEGITEPTAFIEEMEDDEAPQSPPAISPAVIPLDISFDLALDTHSYAPVITLPGESPFVEAAGDDDVQTVQTPASAAPLVTVDSSTDISVEVIDVILEMDSSSASITLLDASPSMDTLDYDILKPVQLLETVAPVVTSELSVEVVGLGLGTLPFDLDFTLVGVPSSVEAVDDDKVKRESSTTTAVIPAPTSVLSVEVIDAALEVPSPVPETTLPEIAPSESIDVMVDDAVKGVVPPAPVTPVASPVSSPDLSVEAVELPLEVHLPIPSVAQLEEEPSVDVVESELSLSIQDAVDLQEPVVPAGASVSLSDICTEDAALKTGATTSLLEASHNDTVDSQQSPAVSACDLSVELPNLTLETHPSDTEATLLDPSACSGTVGDDVVEPEQPPTRDIPVELLELIPETEAYGPADTVPEDACIDVGDHDTVDVTVALKTSLTPVADDDDEPLEPPPDVPLPLCLIVPELVVRYICMVFVRSEIPRSLALYTSGPIWQPIVEARCVILFRTRATISGAQGSQELVKETRCLVLRVAQTTVEVFARDSHEVSHWAGSALVARNSLSVETQRLLKFLRLVYGVTSKRQRKRHPRARGGKRIQEAKVRKATKEAARLARIAEEESHGGDEEETRTAEEASCTVEEEAVCLSEDGRSGTLDEGVELAIEEVMRTTEYEEMRTVDDSEAAGPLEEATQDTGTSLSSQKNEPCGDHPEGSIKIVVEDTTEASESSGSQPALASRRRRRRNRTATSTDKPSDSPTIPSTSMEEEGAGVARIVEDALDEAAGSSGTAPPRAGTRRSRRGRTATT
ncbi:hypothetical protein FOMPIDRAFT_1053179 [Fomitopsis schrenkii]|uniref:Uncharacterized protein n=1 Tax=Fomitopsis schrenkii TaxID=2126942 RepID=S8DZH0_FOMSC|nr:hypothetical protein FOMPIDRAFT_1053179 [Fomitopsis schrenkii]